MIDHAIVQRFWDRRAALADDPRATTLDREPGWWVRATVGLSQRWMLRQLATAQVPWRRVIDLGAGNGVWTEVLAARAEQLIAVDFSAPLLAAAERRVRARGAAGQVSFVVGDLTGFAFPTDCDLILLGGVLQYLDDRDAEDLVRRAASALSDRGALYLRTTTARHVRTIENFTDDYQAIYREAGWYEDRLRGAGLDVAAVTTGTVLLADEPVHRLVGPRLWPTIGRGLAMPLRRMRRLQRRGMATEIHHWLARPFE